MRVMTVLVLVLLSAACTSARGRPITSWSSPTTRDSADGKRISISTFAHGPTVDLEEVEARRKFIADIEADHLVILQEADATLTALEKQARHYATENTLFGLSGGAAAITAAVLVAASPANAAAVAGLATYSSGVAGYQTMLVNAGFSREMMAKVHQLVRLKVTDADDKFATEYRKLLINAEDGAWESAARGATAALMAMRAAAVLVPMIEAEAPKAVDPPPKAVPQEDPKPKPADPKGETPKPSESKRRDQS